MNFIEKLGTTKVLCFSIGELISAFVTIIAAFQESNIEPWQMISFPLIGHIFVLFVFVFRGMNSDKFDWKEIGIAMLGSLVIQIAACIGALFNILSN